MQRLRCLEKMSRLKNILDFIFTRGDKTSILHIEAPEAKWSSAGKVFDEVYRSGVWLGKSRQKSQYYCNLFPHCSIILIFLIYVCPNPYTSEFFQQLI